MTKLFSPIGNGTNFVSGLVANGYKLFFYAAGTSTKQNTYTTSAGVTPNSNPMVLDAYGVPAQQIWLTDGATYKIVIAPPLDTDPPASGITLGDNIIGINNTQLSTGNQWLDAGVTGITYLSATSFSVTGDQRATLEVGRRLKTTNTSGFIYSTITASVFGAVTTVTVVNDSGTLDSGLNAVACGILTTANPSIPKQAIVDGSTATTQAADNATTKVATTAYVDTQAKQEAGNFSGVVAITTTPYTLLATDAGKIHTCASSAAAVTMPAIAGLTVGDTLTLTNQLTTNITITADGASTFAGVLGSTTVVTLNAYSSVTIVKSDTAVWSVTAFAGSQQQRVIASGNLTAAANLSFVLSTLDVTQAITNTYKLVMYGFQPASDDVELRATFSSDGGGSYVAGTGYQGGIAGVSSDNVAKSIGSNGIAYIVVAGASTGTYSMSNAAGETGWLECTILQMNSGTSAIPHIETQCGYLSANAGLYVSAYGGGANITAADYDAIRFAWEGGGNFAAVGSYVLYKLS
jgi:hypothetical protein